MPRLEEIYVAVRTRNVEDAGTSDLPNLIVSRGSQDLLQVALEGDELQTGRAAIFRVDVSGEAIDSEDIELQLVASGNDAWSPEHVIAWGIAGQLPRERVVALGARMDLATPLTPPEGGKWLSTDTTEGDAVLTLTRVGAGASTTRARRLIVVVATDPYPNMFPASPGPLGPGHDYTDRGTVGPLTLQAGAPGRLMLNYVLPKTPQHDLGYSTANFYVTDLAASFSRADLTDGQFTLTISQADYWMPDYFGVFGLDTAFGQPAALIPFVAASAFVLPQMSTDPSEGWHSTVLPTAQLVVSGGLHPPVVSGDRFETLMARRRPTKPDGRARGGQATTSGATNGTTNGVTHAEDGAAGLEIEGASERM